jgi:hypothetical protein
MHTADAGLKDIDVPDYGHKREDGRENLKKAHDHIAAVGAALDTAALNSLEFEHAPGEPEKAVAARVHIGHFKRLLSHSVALHVVD